MDKIDKFLETCNVLKLNQEEAENLNRPVTIREIEAVIKKPPAHKSPGPDSLTGKFHQTFRKKLISILLKLFQKIQEEGRLPNSFYEASIILIPNQVKTQQRKKTTGQHC